MCSARDRLREVREEPVRVRDVARAEGASQFHFIRQFVALFGETPRQFQMQARIDRAKELLATTDLPVTEICMEVGFSSLGSFSALFARRVGMPPSAYRRRPPAPVDCLSMMGAVPAGTAIFEKR
jgi:AraC-like DNA-binding protein